MSESEITIDKNYLLESLDRYYSKYENMPDNVISDDIIFIPKLNVSIKPIIYNLEENSATLGYYLKSPEWKNQIYECSASFGDDTKDAVNIAQGSFILGIMESIKDMKNDFNGIPLESRFAGKVHRWKAYIGEIFWINEKVSEENQNIYWNVLKDEILKRIGNQDLCYIKIYAANSGDGKMVIGECRVNDVRIESLSKIIEDIASEWNNTQFVSHKQFFVLRQEKETLIDYPYTDEQIASKTKDAMILFEKCINQDNYDDYFGLLMDLIQDETLANDLYDFIPEICAENAFNEVKYSEEITFLINRKYLNYYKTQISSYYPIMKAVFEIFEDGSLNDSKKVYCDYVGISSIAHALEHQGQLDSLVMSAQIFNPTDGYIIR